MTTAAIGEHSFDGEESVMSVLAGEEMSPVRRERRDAAEHRRRILSAAKDLFAEHGVDAVAMQQIARAAGVGQGTLYRRYAHKGQLCLDLLADASSHFRKNVYAFLAAPDAPAPALDKLDAVLMKLAAFNEDNGALLGAVVDAANGEYRTSMYHSSLYRWLHAVVQALLERAAAEGESLPLDIAYTTDAILAALAIDLYLYQRHELGFSQERITKALRRLYSEGLRASPAP